MNRIRSKTGRSSVAVTAVLLLSIAALMWHERSAAIAGNTNKPLESLPVATVTTRDIRQLIEVPGEFRPYQEVDIDAKVRGYVQTVLNDVGDHVRKGAVLATLEIPELADDLRSAAAAVAVAEQQAQRAHTQHADEQAIYQRLRGVMQERPELIAQQDIDQAKAKADESLAAETAAEASIKQALAEQTRVRDTAAYTKIYAPFDGVITQRLLDPGALVGASGSGAATALFHISDVDRLRLVLQIPESTVPDVAVGKTAHISVSALQKSYDLPVSRISQQLAEATRTMHVEIDFDNARQRVAPGMYAEVQLPLQEHLQVAAIPLAALRDHAADSDSGKVYVLEPDGRVQLRPVTVGLAGPNHVEIKTGLKAGELVVVDVTPRLDADARYAPKRSSDG